MQTLPNPFEVQTLTQCCLLWKNIHLDKGKEVGGGYIKFGAYNKLSADEFLKTMQ